MTTKIGLGIPDLLALDGATNMAIDEALLQAVREAESACTAFV
ncbi:MAG: hypothetical protein U0528_03850 [Anaerolineae bacterium]